MSKANNKKLVLITTKANSIIEKAEITSEAADLSARGQNAECVSGSTEKTEQRSNWTEFIKKIQDGNSEAVEELYKIFSPVLRGLLGRQLGMHDLEDKIHDVFIVVLQAVRNGSIREPQCLPGFIRGVAQRSVSNQIRIRINNREREREMPHFLEPRDDRKNPEEQALANQRTQTAMTALRRLSVRDREILMRFYVDEQAPTQICSEMNLTETQFRIHKWRAKGRFGQIGKGQLKMKLRAAA